MIPPQSGSVDPIISRLRPRTMGELLDHSFRLYRRHFLTFLAITAVVYIPVQLAVQVATAFLQGEALSVDELTSVNRISQAQLNERFLAIIISAIALILLSVLGGLLEYLSQGALTAGIADSHLDRPVSFGRAYAAMRKKIGPLLGAIGLQILAGLAIFVPLFLLFALAASAAGSSGSGGGAGALVCLGVLAFIPIIGLFAYINIRWSLVVPAIMVEDLGPREGLRRSWQLIGGYWWRTFGLTLLLSILTAVIAGGPSAVVLGLFAAFFRNLDPVALSLVSGIVTVIISLFIFPLQLITITLLYFDLRVRKEGFDIETAMAQRYWQPYGPQPAMGYPPPPGMAPPALGQPPYGQPPAQGYGGYPYGYPPPQEPPAGAGTPTMPISEGAAGAYTESAETQTEAARVNPAEPPASADEKDA